MKEEFVVLVDEADHALGVMEKMEAHRKGLLHRAISVFIFNSAGDLLIHKRAENKYHSAGLWTNACCSHPRDHEDPKDAAVRRLREEMGLECRLHPAFTFVYRAELDHDLTEHELDHVFIGTTDSAPQPDPEEVAEWKYISMNEVRRELDSAPENYTEWFRIIFPRITPAMIHA
jgi:isopentenyl-diphosphate Delta-isomerase